MANVRSDLSRNGTSTLSIDREKKRNALDRQTLIELESAFENASAESLPRCITTRQRGGVHDV